MISNSNCQIMFWSQHPSWQMDCAGPENVHTPPKEGIGIPVGGGGGGSVRPNNLKKCVKLNFNFQRVGKRVGGRGLEKTLPWGRYGFFSGITHWNFKWLFIFYLLHPYWDLIDGLKVTDRLVMFWSQHQSQWQQQQHILYYSFQIEKTLGYQSVEDN